VKPIRRIKIINGKEYWYEDTPYYDQEKKQIRHRSKYLGKNVDGMPVKVRSEPEKLKQNKELKPPKSFHYGNILPLTHIINDLNIENILSESLGEKEVQMLISLSINRILRPTAMRNLNIWFEGTSLALDYPELNLSGQRISEFLEYIGRSDVELDFMSKFVKNMGTEKTLLYDITSFSSYSKYINLLEFGYNRDGKNLPQLNLGLIVDKNENIPIMYDIFPGSIVDVSTLKNTLKKLQANGIEDYTAVMDRGFFSKTNILELLDENVSFIVPATLKLDIVKDLFDSAAKEIDDLDYLEKYNKQTFFVKPIVLNIDDQKLNGYFYYDPKRAQQEKETFWGRLYDIRESLKTKIPNSKREPTVVLKENAGRYSKYFTVEKVEDNFIISIVKDAAEERVQRMGRFILFYRGEFDCKTCLLMYRERDLVEKSFRELKNDLGGLPLNMQKDETTKGFIFVSYIALILRMKLMKMMTDTDLCDRYSIESLLMELEKISKVRLSSGEIIVSEITKKERNILKALELCA